MTWKEKNFAPLVFFAFKKEATMNKILFTKRLFSLLVIILALALAACGTSGSSTKINFTMTDFAFNPNEFTIPAGEEITLQATHNGTMEHNFIVMKYGTDAGDIFDEADKVNVFWEVDLQPGDSKTIIFTAPDQPGKYQIICGMTGHLQSGMVGKLIVTEQQ
jgi:plastocyanin